MCTSLSALYAYDLTLKHFYPQPTIWSTYTLQLEFFNNVLMTSSNMLYGICGYFKNDLPNLMDTFKKNIFNLDESPINNPVDTMLANNTMSTPINTPYPMPTAYTMSNPSPLFTVSVNEGNTHEKLVIAGAFIMIGILYLWKKIFKPLYLRKYNSLKHSEQLQKEVLKNTKKTHDEMEEAFDRMLENKKNKMMNNNKRLTNAIKERTKTIILLSNIISLKNAKLGTKEEIAYKLNKIISEKLLNGTDMLLKKNIDIIVKDCEEILSKTIKDDISKSITTKENLLKTTYWMVGVISIGSLISLFIEVNGGIVFRDVMYKEYDNLKKQMFFYYTSPILNVLLDQGFYGLSPDNFMDNYENHLKTISPTHYNYPPTEILREFDNKAGQINDVICVNNINVTTELISENSFRLINESPNTETQIIT